MELTETEDMISFSAGFPSPETYPVEEIKESFIQVLDREGKEALSYCSTSGYGKLREIIANRMHDKFDLDYSANEVIITSGSQQALTLVATVLLEPGDAMLLAGLGMIGFMARRRSNRA